MKLSKYAEKIGVKRATATKWFHKGLIKGAYQLPGVSAPNRNNNSSR